MVTPIVVDESVEPDRDEDPDEFVHFAQSIPHLVDNGRPKNPERGAAGSEKSVHFIVSTTFNTSGSSVAAPADLRERTNVAPPLEISSGNEEETSAQDSNRITTTQRTQRRKVWRCVSDIDAEDSEDRDATKARINDVDAEDGNDVKGRVKRAARHIYATTWPRGVIPYQFEWGMEAWQKHMIRRVMTIWESSTCIRFREWPMAYNRY